MQTERTSGSLSESSTTSVTKPPTESTPRNFVDLNYSLHTRKRSIAIVWTFLIVITCLQLEFFYFILRYAAKTSEDTALTVPTAILLALSILSIMFRTWKLARKGSKCRPIDGAWYGLDFFAYNAIVGFVVVTAVLASATGADPPNYRQASMSQAIILYLASSQLILTGVMSSMGWKAPFRLSSTLRGDVTRPGVYVLIEDIAAVDGAGGQKYRERLIARYQSSKPFRSLVAQLNWFWGIGSFALAITTTVIFYVVEDLNVVWALGWCLPWVWAAIAAAITVFWAKRMLRIEKRQMNLTVG